MSLLLQCAPKIKVHIWNNIVELKSFLHLWGENSFLNCIARGLAISLSFTLKVFKAIMKKITFKEMVHSNERRTKKDPSGSDRGHAGMFCENRGIVGLWRI